MLFSPLFLFLSFSIASYLVLLSSWPNSLYFFLHACYNDATWRIVYFFRNVLWCSASTPSSEMSIPLPIAYDLDSAKLERPFRNPKTATLSALYPPFTRCDHIRFAVSGAAEPVPAASPSKCDSSPARIASSARLVSSSSNDKLPTFVGRHE